MRKKSLRNRNSGGVVSEFVAKQRDVLTALSASPVPPTSKKEMFDRVARRLGITVSQAAKAWRGYVVLPGDVWERAQEKAGLTPAEELTSDAHADRERIRELEASLADLHRKVDAVLSRMEGAPPHSVRG